MFDHFSLGTIIISLVAVLFSLSIHEASHAGMAYLLDDDTAARLGRLTLNPIAHISLLGTVVIPLILAAMGLPAFGWAKPVPVNPAKLTRKFTQRVGYAMVAAAGPLSNLVMFGIFTVALSLFVRVAFLTGDIQKWNIFRDAFSMSVEHFLQVGTYSVGQVMILTLASRLILINLVLAIFNLLPFGPLDGSGILRGFIPYRYLGDYDRIQPIASIVMLVLLMFGALDYILGPIQYLALNYFVGPVARLIIGV